METIDRRTRVESGARPVNPEAFVNEDLPALVADNGELLARAVHARGLRPLGVVVDDTAFTLAPTGSTDLWRTGIGDDAMVVELRAEQFSDWVNDLRSLTAFTVAGDLTLKHGPWPDFQWWDVVWRALLDGRPVHEPGAVTFSAPDGGPLDLTRRFGPDDDPADVAHFIREAGFAHIVDWLDADMAVIAADVARAAGTYHLDDGRSWWATLDDGSQRPVRLQQFVEHSPETAALLSGPAWNELRRTIEGPDELVQPPVEGNCIEALIKPIGVAKGLSDLPWHRDCTLGRHSYGCCSVTVGISVTEGGRGRGLLRVVAGSHRAATPAAVFPDLDLPVIALPTQPGDLTVHLSCTMHEATPPTLAERIVLYIGFGLPPRPDDGGVDRKAMQEFRDRAHKLVSQPANATRTIA